MREYKSVFLSFLLLLASFILFFSSCYAACPDEPDGDSGSGGTAASSDPNALTGPAGYGNQHYVPAGTVLTYRIDFENDASASAPAQQVDITNFLPAEMDWQSFQLTEIAFGDTFITIPPGQSDYSATLPFVVSDTTLNIRIEAGIHQDTGEVYAHFYTIDPATGLPPSVELGFLPPEDGFGSGMGHISYLINHTSGLAEGTEIRNLAQIRFDLGEIIATNQVDPHDPAQGTDPEKEAPVTIDAHPPESSVTHLEAAGDNSYTVYWSGSDSSSDIKHYDVYYRDMATMQWQPWMMATTSTSAVFVGLPGHIYEFYSSSTDNVGYVETQPPVAEVRLVVPGLPDKDEDGIADGDDNCPHTSNPEQLDTDLDGIGDVCDNDDDNDGVIDSEDNCPMVANASQEDLDQDGYGDACDQQTCGNGILEEPEECDDGNRLDGDGCTPSCRAGLAINISSVDYWGVLGLMQIKGDIRLPAGASLASTEPVAAVELKLNETPVIEEQFDFTAINLWKPYWISRTYLGPFTLGVKTMTILWERPSLAYHGLLDIYADIAEHRSYLVVRRAGMEGAYSLQIGRNTVYVDAANHVSSDGRELWAYYRPKKKELILWLFVGISPDTEIVIRQEGLEDIAFIAGKHLAAAKGIYRILFGLPMNTLPAQTESTLVLDLSLGSKPWAGSATASIAPEKTGFLYPVRTGQIKSDPVRDIINTIMGGYGL